MSTTSKSPGKVALVAVDVGKGAGASLEVLLEGFPEQTRWGRRMLLEQLDVVAGQIRRQGQRLKALVELSPAIQRLMSLAGVGTILASVIALEIGDVGRLPSGEHLASYTGTTRRVHASGGKVRYGQLRPEMNRYLKWAFVEAANVIARHRGSWPDRHVSRLYERLRSRKAGLSATTP